MPLRGEILGTLCPDGPGDCADVAGVQRAPNERGVVDDAPNGPGGLLDGA